MIKTIDLATKKPFFISNECVNMLLSKVNDITNGKYVLISNFADSFQYNSIDRTLWFSYVTMEGKLSSQYISLIDIKRKYVIQQLSFIKKLFEEE